MNTIAAFKNLHTGKRLFILASGPSLGDLDLSPLSRRLTMGLNRSFMAWPETNYHCVMDHRLFDMYPTELQQTRYLFTLADRPWGIPIDLLGSQGWSDDLTTGVYTGYTIAYVGLQIAVWMGFAEIFFLGLDLTNRAGNTHFFGFDHCSARHEDTEFPKMIRSFDRAVEAIRDRDIAVYNCSPSSALTCFPHCSFADAIAR